MLVVGVIYILDVVCVYISVVLFVFDINLYSS